MYPVHPDKNQDDPDRAQQAFEAVNKAWKTLENEETRKKCMDIIEEAVGRTDLMVRVILKNLLNKKHELESAPYIWEKNSFFKLMGLKLFLDLLLYVQDKNLDIIYINYRELVHSILLLSK